MKRVKLGIDNIGNEPSRDTLAAMSQIPPIRIGAIYFIIMVKVFGNLAAIGVFIEERAAFL